MLLAVCVSGDDFDGAFAMWVWLDRVGLILFDAALSTGLFLSVVVLAMLVCRQPSRRLLIVRSSLLASLAMVPLVAVVPLPRLDVLAMILPGGFASARRRRSTRSRDNRRPGTTRRRGTGCVRSSRVFKGDYAAWAGRWLPRSLTLIVLDGRGDRRRVGAAGFLGRALAAAPFARAVTVHSSGL